MRFRPVRRSGGFAAENGTKKRPLGRGLLAALRRSSGFLNLAGANALNANFTADNTTVFHDANILNVRFKRAGGNFYDVHTDSALFLGKTSTDDGCSLRFLLSANFTDVAHFISPR